MANRPFKHMPGEHVLYRATSASKPIIAKVILCIRDLKQESLYTLEGPEGVVFDAFESSLQEKDASVLDTLRPLLAQRQALNAQIDLLMPRVFEDFKQRLELATTREHVRVLSEELDWWDTDDELTTARRLLLRKYSEGKLQ